MSALALEGEMTAMSLSDFGTVIGIAAAVASVVLAVVAIGLSVQFFRMSQTNAKDAANAAKDIQASVEQLEGLFDRLYSDTFGMVRDTFSDMRQRVFTAPSESSHDAELRAEQRIAEMSEKVTSEIERLTKHAGATDAELGKIRGQLNDVVGRALAESSVAAVEAQRATLEERILALLAEHPWGVNGLMSALVAEGFTEEDTVRVLFELRRAGRVVWRGSETSLSWGTTVSLRPTRTTAISRQPREGKPVV